jgi:hypothetical protein
MIQKGRPYGMGAKWFVEVFVRRGALRRFDAFRRKTMKLPVRVRWDRRVESRDVPGASDRRQSPPFTWDAADFVVVERPSEPNE